MFPAAHDSHEAARPRAAVLACAVDSAVGDEGPARTPGGAGAWSGQPGYAENGLRALLKIGWYRDSYEAVVDVWRSELSLLAEDLPIEPSEVPDIDKMTSPFSPDRRLRSLLSKPLPRRPAP